MDFSFSEAQLGVREAAEAVFGGVVTPARVAAVEDGHERVDRALWAALAAADLLGLGVPQGHGGAGLGLGELCVLLEAQGRCVAPVPLWATLVLGALPLARYGSDDLRERWLPAVVRGQAFLSAALSGAAADSEALPVEALAVPGGWCLSGLELAVPQAHLAARVLVPARSVRGEVIVALVDPAAPGVTWERAETTNREIHPHLHLAQVLVGGDEVLMGERIVPFMLEVAGTALCALALGVAEAALAQTAAYVNERHQFGRPLSSFQATMLRAADAAIDIEAMRATMWQAAWRLDSGRDAAEAVAVAMWQAAERGQGVVHATQHLHGGVGADVAYPIHRYFLWNKQIELLLGGPSAQLARLGRLVAGRYRARPGPADRPAGGSEAC